jgi:hypothetical protein
MYIRHKKTPDGRRYYQIVETVQTNDGKNKQKVVKYLGTVEKILSVFENTKKIKNGTSRRHNRTNSVHNNGRLGTKRSHL